MCRAERSSWHWEDWAEQGHVGRAGFPALLFGLFFFPLCGCICMEVTAHYRQQWWLGALANKSGGHAQGFTMVADGRVTPAFNKSHWCDSPTTVEHQCPRAECKTQQQQEILHEGKLISKCDFYLCFLGCRQGLSRAYRIWDCGFWSYKCNTTVFSLGLRTNRLTETLSLTLP